MKCGGSIPGNITQPQKEGSINISYNVDKPLETWCSVKGARHKWSHIALFHLQEISRMGKPTETKQMVEGRGWGREG